MIRTRTNRALAAAGAFALGVPVLAAGVLTAAADEPVSTYRVTIVNTTTGQPFSPPVVATHSRDVDLFEVGERASTEIAAIAQAGDQSGAVALLGSLGDAVTSVEQGAPSRPLAGLDGPPSVQTVDIEGHPDDVLSLATMLICTNDGFTGVDSIALPEAGTTVVPLQGYDAGVERNTQRSRDIVDPCSLLGPTVLSGDDNGNNDGRPAAHRWARQITEHRTVNPWRGDLQREHDWRGQVGVVLVQKTG
ncbi:MAG: spondin domain-containing protein [Jiangellales bacterium]